MDKYSDSRWPVPVSARLWDRLAGLDDCQEYIVLVADPDTQETDAHGPYTGLDALGVADAFRRDLDAIDLGEVRVTVTPLYRPTRGDHRSR